MRSTYDGYKIAEIDLEMRGPGEFFSTASDGTIRQSGGLSLRLSSMCDDTAQLRDAFTDARAILDADPLLGAPEHRLLGEEVRRMFSISDNTLS